MSLDPLTRHYDLSVIDVSIDLTAEPVVVRFRVEITGTVTGEVHVPAAAIGVPVSLAELRLLSAEPSFQIPPGALDDLRRALHLPRRPSTRPVWLRLRRPWGYLPAIPWERLLQPALGVPVLRLPFYAVPPVATYDQLRVVVCASSRKTPGTIPVEDLVDELIEQVAGVSERTRIDVFADAEAYPRVADRLSRRSDAPGVHVHDPSAWAGAERRQLEQKHDAMAVDDQKEQYANPWLRWMMQVLNGAGVDVLHLVAPGYLSANYGAVALPASPISGPDDGKTCLLGAADLKAFQRRTGSWLLGFTVPRPGVNNVGLRLLAHRMAQQWTGPVLLYDPYADATRGLELGHAYPWLFLRGAGVPRTPALTLYCHPGAPMVAVQPAHTRAPMRTDPANLIEAWAQTYTLAKGRTLGMIEDEHGAPAWVTADQRSLERAAALLIEPISGNQRASVSQQAARRGVEDALQFVSDVIERYASAEP